MSSSSTSGAASFQTDKATTIASLRSWTGLAVVFAVLTIAMMLAVARP